MDDIIYSGCELISLDAMNRSSMWITLAIMDRELRALDAMNSLSLWLT